MTYFGENENSGPYLDTNNKYIPYDEEDNYYKNGMMNPSSMKDYKANKEEVSKVTKIIVGLIKSIRNSQDDYNF